MSIKLRVGGKDYSNWTSVSVSRSMDAASGAFNFVAASDEKQPFPVKTGDPVSVVIGGTEVMNGYIDMVEVSYTADNHHIQVTGRDKTADIIDSKVDHEIEFQAPISLDEVAKQTLANIGASDVKIVNNIKDLKPFEKGELISASIGQGAFDFIESYARKRQALVTTDGKGSLVLTRADEDGPKISFNNVIGGKDNNIKSASVSYDDTERYSDYKLYSQGNPGGDEDVDESSEQLTNRTATYKDKEIRSSRKYSNLAESSSKEEPLSDRVQWEAEIRKAKSFKYECAVVGFTAAEDGPPYEPNKLANVKDDFSNVDRELLITDIEYTLSLYEGSITRFTLIPKEAYSTLKKEDQFQGKPASKTPKKAADEADTGKRLAQVWGNNDKTVK